MLSFKRTHTPSFITEVIIQSFDNNFICITPTSERSLCAGSGSTGMYEIPFQTSLQTSPFQTSQTSPLHLLHLSRPSKGPTGFSPMIGVTFGPTGQLIAASPMENRVLMYPTPNGLNTNTGPNAVVSFGSTLTTSGAGNNPSASTLLSPQGVTFDQARDRLYIADSGWNRVLQFAPTGGDALKVWGQANFATGACNAGARVPDSSTLCNPSTTAISSDGSILFVVDRGNHRVVGYVGSNTQATILIGQALFSDSQPNRGFTSIAQGLDGPNDIALDSQNNVYIADTNNNRTVIYTFGQWDVPSGVIGQTSINTTSGTQLSRPTSVRLYNGAPYIADAVRWRFSFFFFVHSIFTPREIAALFATTRHLTHLFQLLALRQRELVSPFLPAPSTLLDFSMLFFWSFSRFLYVQPRSRRWFESCY